jgi:nucleoside-diphosphate-sugar epimerase
VSRVVITGARGLIGGILTEGLRGDFELTGIDARDGVDMRDLRAAERAFAGAEVLIDLAANPSTRTSWQDVYTNNLPATANALEAAHRVGVKRVVFASSNHVTGLYERDHPYSAIVAGEYEGLDPASIPPITSSHPIRPDGPYGVGKAFGEAAGRFYADVHGLSVVCLRIGTVNAENRPRNVRERATLLTHRDLVHLVDACIRAPGELRFAVFFGVSANTWRFWEIGDAAAAVGYRPQDDAGAQT